MAKNAKTNTRRTEQKKNTHRRTESGTKRRARKKTALAEKADKCRVVIVIYFLHYPRFKTGPKTHGAFLGCRKKID